MAIDESISPSTPTKAGTSEAADLRGNLGTASLVLTVIAYNGPIIILAGLIPLIIASGNGLSAPATFLTLGILVAVFAVGINAMASRMTHAGAFYTYVTSGLGRPAGLAAGMVAILAYMALGTGCVALFGISLQNLLTSVVGIENGPSWQVWALAAWAVISVLSMFNIELSAKVLGVLSCCEILVTLIWNGKVFINGGPQGRVFDVFGSYFSGSLPLALVLGITCLTGFESLQVFRAETTDSHRTVPRATYISVGIMTILYVLSSYSFIVAYGPSKALTAGAEDATASFLHSVTSYVAKSVADIANVLLTTSTFAAALAIQTILSRYLYSLGRDRVLPAALGRPNVKHGSPMAAAMVAAAASLAILALPALGIIDPSNAFATLIAAGTFCLVVLYFTTSIAIFRFFQKRDEQVSKLKSVVAPLISTFGMGAILFLSIINMNDVLGQSWTVAIVCLMFIGAIIIAGLVLAFWLRANRPETFEKIGRQSETATF